MLSGCGTGTTEVVRTVSDGCLVFSGIGYASQPSGQQETAENKYDTVDTVKEVEKHNLVFQKLCPQM